MKIRLYNLVSDLVKRGAERGWKNAFDRTDSPDDAQIVSSVHKAIMLELTEYIDFDSY